MPKKKSPEELADQVNLAIRSNERLVTFDIEDDKKLSLIAECVEAIWEA
jgi:hypothetical protein